MFTPQQQTLVEAMQARRFLDSIPSLSIDQAIVIIHDPSELGRANRKLNLFARNPSVVDWVLTHLKLVKYMAWLTCGVETVALLCYGETVDEFATRDILIGNADAETDMTTATLGQSAVDNAPVSPIETVSTDPTPTIAATDLYTIAELSDFAHQTGFDPTAIADEIRAINPRAFRRNGEDLYELDAAYQAIDRLKDEAKERLKSVAAQNRVVAKAQAPAAKPRTAAQKKPAARRSAAKTTAK
ncbi:MAG: hypothetical protein KME13_23925 [Myxacorys californica WJT36-NPBG1]|jgi:hypothetical protein|nr:hypothetical protein [Myxacorys californica WJT36-NPBG1]